MIARAVSGLPYASAKQSAKLKANVSGKASWQHSGNGGRVIL
jgi:hypothetical protein